MHSIACANRSGSFTMSLKDQLSKSTQSKPSRFSVHHSSPPSTCCTQARSSYTAPWRSEEAAQLLDAVGFREFIWVLFKIGVVLPGIAATHEPAVFLAFGHERLDGFVVGSLQSRSVRHGLSLSLGACPAMPERTLEVVLAIPKHVP